MDLEFLANKENAIPLLARWYFEEWGHLEKGNTLDKVTEKLHGYLNTDKIPLIVLAVEGGEILGAAQLKYREMDIYPEKEHWLGGVYVSKNHRGNKLAEQIIRKVVSIAGKLDVHKLYLQTENLSGGLYTRLGWLPIEQVNYRGLDVLVMEKEIGV
ncbi:MAG: GNAT family N-acetyltransferase [Halobacteria archaeon]|nr:GNAT family N-acetyltransferase [Halobacteria archaeon]